MVDAEDRTRVGFRCGGLWRARPCTLLTTISQRLLRRRSRTWSSPGKVVAVVAGATDLIPRIRDGAFHPDLVVDIKGLPHVRDLVLLTASTPGDPSPSSSVLPSG